MATDSTARGSTSAPLRNALSEKLGKFYAKKRVMNTEPIPVEQRQALTEHRQAPIKCWDALIEPWLSDEHSNVQVLP